MLKFFWKTVGKVRKALDIWSHQLMLFWRLVEWLSFFWWVCVWWVVLVLGFARCKMKMDIRSKKGFQDVVP